MRGIFFDPARPSVSVTRMRLAVVLSSVLIVVAAGGAQASPTVDISTLQAKVEKLRHEAEIASESYNDTREQLKGLDVRVGAAQVRLDAQRRRVQESQRLVGQLAAESYRNGSFGTLELYLGDDPDTLLAQAGVVETLADRQTTAVLRLKAEQRELATDIADLGRQKAKVSSADAKLAGARRAVEAKLAAARALLSRLTAEQRRALDRASRDAERRAAQDDGSGAPPPTSSPSGTSTTCGDVGVSAPSARVKAVLAYACAQIGDPYRWGAAGPDSFDCSGLTMQAWARGGVSLPHSSRMQATYGTRVSSADMRAGDLVFFYSPISHVAIYLGNGMMVTAPQTGDSVRVKAVMYKNLVAVVRL